MIKIHTTKKLLAKLPIDEEGFLPPSKYPQADIPQTEPTINPLSNWHANLITLQRSNCILFVHDQTRFAVLLTCVKKPDFADLNWHFQDALMNTLLKTGAEQIHLDMAASLLQPLCFDNDCNRSVQGTMNQMAGDLKHTLYYNSSDVRDLAPYRTSAWLSDRPCTVKGVKDCVWPIRAMGELLGGERPVSSKTMALGTHQEGRPEVPSPEGDVDMSNVFQISEFRK